MELRQIEYFIAVAEELHFGRAAKRLQMTQPPLSQQILQLENDLGVTLFERTRRHVELTNAGKVFLQESRQILIQLERAKTVAQRAQKGMLGRLALGFVGSATFDILPNIVRAFQDQYPSVDLILHEMPTPMQIEAFHRKHIDIGFVRTPVDDRLLTLLPVHQETCVAVVPNRHQLAQHRSLSMEDLSGEPFILVEREVWPSWYDDIVSKCREAGFSPNIRQNVKEIQTVVGLVAAGLGISIVPSSTSNLHARDVTFMNIRGSAPQITMSLAWRTDNNSPLIQHFLETAVQLTKSCD
ncbi:LysR family transcriptional regulator [Paenibacillus eucommiae]|uniref:DNA-binding transcriptional LysR family regulator n=1 Tax=Paenibacillus eucommiae TaxID=1355755 RepID=A0ABS4J1W7_9BACL|nr:LysR family transcriptional regulator [Paenibacillus eucommiae]MBP1993834.1 DNA-binding transcriptional LysR family regulator [Paenibacillus eucommiae]